MQRDVRARQKDDILRLRGEEGKPVREWECREDRIAKSDHENVKSRVSWREAVEAAQARQYWNGKNKLRNCWK